MYDVEKVEEEAQEHWREIDLLTKIQEKNEDGDKYFLLDGPPYANYVPHVGHMRTTLIKDLYIRLAMMKGRDVFFQPGFDTHGLPIENMVEKDLGLESKKDIEELGINEFIEECRSSAIENKDLWLDYYDKLGVWYAWKEPYLTFNNSYLESAWWAFKQQWEKDMVYEGKKPVHWCPHCQTALAGYEVTDSYKTMTDPGVYVLFRLKEKDSSLLVFTTTPWTLPSNTIIAVAPDEDYVEVETEDHGNVILAKERLELLDEFEVDYEVEDEFKGEELVDMEYESLVDVPVQEELQEDPKALKVYESIPILKERAASKVSGDAKDVYEEFVSVEEGTGLVHVAPGHGKTDNEVGNHYDLPSPSPLDDACRFTEGAGEWEGEFVKDADHDIADYLHGKGKLLKFQNVQHQYPVCWRCKNPLIFRLSNQWFLKIEGIKDLLLDENEDVNWQPDFAKERMRNWIANAEDWNISRQRYWGIPMPVWRCEECDELKIVGGLDELREEAADEVPEGFDLHAASEVNLECSCGEEMERLPHIFDVWYDSGSAPFASMGYPYDNKEQFEKYFPPDRISESQDQIRGWFYHLLFQSASLFGKAPFESVSMPGWTLDDKGEKMSKSVGNVVFAMDAIEKHGADAVRFYYCWDTPPYNTQKFNMDTITEEVRKFFNIYWNLHNYLLSQEVEPEEPEPKEVEDEWILSRLNTVLEKARDGFEDFELQQAGRGIYNFIVEDLSRSYVQMVRERVEEGDTPVHVINHCMLEITKILAPISPHVSEKVYQGLKNVNDGLEESVHLEGLPEAQESDPELEEMMEVAQDIIASALSCRDRSHLGVRWPLQRIILDTDEELVEETLKRLSSVIEKQVNVKEVVVKEVQPDYEVSPAFDRLGPEFGEETGDVANLIKDDADHIAEDLKDGEEEWELDGYEISKEHLNVEKVAPEGLEVADFRHGTVYLDTELTPELEEEGFMREVTRRVQQLRKEAGLEKGDAIELAVEAQGIADSLKKYEDEIKEKVGAFSLKIDEKVSGDYEHSLKDEVNDEEFTVMFNS